MDKQQRLEQVKRQADALEDIYPIIYYAERLLQSFRENYFSSNEESFPKDEDEKYKFVYSYEEMSATLFAINELLFNVRLKTDFAMGINSDIVKAHIENEAEMQRGILKQTADCKESA